MELPSLQPWSAGMEHDEDAFNAVTYALNFLLDPPECRVNQTSTQSIPNVSPVTYLTFNSASKDNDGMWDSGHPTYITIQTSGWYEIEWAVCWATKADTTLRAQPLMVNGATALSAGYAYNSYLNTGGTNPQTSWSYDMFLSEGDQLAIGVVQLTGASLSTASSGSIKNQQTFLHVRWASL